MNVNAIVRFKYDNQSNDRLTRDYAPLRLEESVRLCDGERLRRLKMDANEPSTTKNKDYYVACLEQNVQTLRVFLNSIQTPEGVELFKSERKNVVRENARCQCF